MSARVSRGPPPRGGGRRKPTLNVDLNVPPNGNHGQNQEGPSDAAQTDQTTHVRQGPEQGHPDQLPPVTIDVDSIDDDDVVVVSSPRAFAEAKNNLRRIRRRRVVDVDAEPTIRRGTRNKRQRVATNQQIINCENYVNLEGGTERGNCRRSNDQPPAPAPPPPPPKELTFNCPVCMGKLVEEVSTKCGHIFCKACIKAAVAAQSKCPTCRRKVTMREIIRIYLPATS